MEDNRKRKRDAAVGGEEPPVQKAKHELVVPLVVVGTPNVVCSPQSPAVKSMMDELPDDVVMTVMQYLPTVEDVWACRLVCKRFADVALAPDVWRRRRYFGSCAKKWMHEKCPVCPVLRLAPRVGLLYVALAPSLDAPHVLLYTTTKCAAVGLCIELHSWTGREVNRDVFSDAEQLIRHQAALGRLQRVDLTINHDPKSGAESAFVLLLQTIAKSSLKSLVLSERWHGGFPRFAEIEKTIAYPALKSSLTLFHCSLGLEVFQNVMLTAHAGTLESVNLPHCSAAVLPLIARASKVRHLVIPMLAGMEALLACQSLDSLELTARNSDDKDFHFLADFEKHIGPYLRRAEQLRDLRLDSVPTSGVAVALMQALATSGRSRVEYLYVKNSIPLARGGGGLREVQPLLDAVSSLRALNFLELRDVVDGRSVEKLLQGINEQTAPALRYIGLGFEDHVRCPHTWFHNDVVKKVLTENPSLHVLVESRSHDYRRDGDERSCTPCRDLSCHRKYRSEWNESEGRYTFYLGLYSHEPTGGGSGPGCDHTRPGNNSVMFRKDNIFWCHFFKTVLP